MDTCNLLATNILGLKLRTPEGEEVGVIQNLMIDLKKSSIVYIVLCYANFIGKTHRHFAIPSSLVSVSKDDTGRIYLEIDDYKLLTATPFRPADDTHKIISAEPQHIYEVNQDDPAFSNLHMLQACD